MDKRKSLLKSGLACVIASAMLFSMALPALADDTEVSKTESTEITEVTEKDAIVQLENKEDAVEQTTPAVSPANSPADPSAVSPYPTKIVSSESSESATMDEQMKKALGMAKTYFEIDEKIFTEFSYDVYEYDGKTNWSFNWSSNDRDNYIYINVTDELVTSYNKSTSRDDRDNFSFAKLSKSEAEEKAYEFLKVVFGDAAKHFKVYSSSLYYSSRSYDISFAIYKDGYLNTAADMPNVSVDKLTGEIISYYYYNSKYTSASGYDEKNYSYQNSAKIITPEKAAKAFVEKLGVELKYSYNFDYYTKELKIFPIYTVSNTGKYISAVTGEVVDIYSNYSGNARPVAEAAMGASVSDDTNSSTKEQRASDVTYTQAETNELDKLKDYISKDKAIEIAIGVWGLKKDEIKDYNQSVSLSKNYINQNQYIWNISINSNSYAKYDYRYYYATIDARNGTVISYYGSYDRPNDTENSKLKYTYNEAKKIAEAEVKKLAEVYGMKNFEFTENYTESKEKEMLYNFTWHRMVDGTKFDSNYINVEFDNYNGKITSYSVSWFEDAKFPELKKVISAEEAFNKIVEYSEYFPAYIETKYDETKKISSMSLVYMLKNTYVNVDPYTGEYLDYSGKPDSSGQEPDYDDIKGHWCEEVVTTLSDNGIYVWGGKFEPDKAITAKDFISYIKFYSEINYELYYNYERIYKEYISAPTSDGGDSAISEEKANAVITRQEAAKIICELLGYDKLVKMPEYLLYPFDDSVGDEYKGYITIVYILGAIEGYGENSYDATETLTRAEAAQMLYNLLTK